MVTWLIFEGSEDDGKGIPLSCGRSIPLAFRTFLGYGPFTVPKSVSYTLSCVGRCLVHELFTGSERRKVR